MSNAHRDPGAFDQVLDRLFLVATPQELDALGAMLAPPRVLPRPQVQRPARVVLTKGPADWVSAAAAELPALATIDEAASQLRMSTRNLRRKIASGEIRALRARESGSSRVLLPAAEIERYLRRLVVS